MICFCACETLSLKKINRLEIALITSIYYTTRLYISKKNFLENTLEYINQETISQIRRDLAISTDCCILGQLLPAQNTPKNIHAYQSNQDVELIVPLYNLTTGDFQGLSTTLAYIVLRGDADEVSSSYSFTSKKSKALFCSAKDKIPSAFSSTAFKKHYEMFIDHHQKFKEQSDLLYYLPPTRD